MGGDHGLSVTVPAALQVLAKHEDLELILVGDQEMIVAALSAAGGAPGSRMHVQHASQQVMMDESPAKVLRTKKDSSMRIAINLVKNKVAHACVSAGNTGALMATARFVLKTLPGIDRPAIIVRLPTMDPNKGVRLLDLGANVDSSANSLYQFAVMGSVLAQAVDNIKYPKVALLNIGAEDIKGNEQVKSAAQLLLGNKKLNYVGYVEGDKIFQGDVDVIVCDGFIGNVALKSMEGMLRLIGFYMKQAFTRNILTKLVALITLKVLKGTAMQLDPSKRNGGSLIGLQGIVIKSHGSANVVAFANAIEEAMLEARKNVPQLISCEVGKILNS